MKTDLKKLVSEMTLEEKAGLCSGADFWHTKSVERLGIPSIMLSDGPHGLRKQEAGGDHLGIGESIKATCFPAACATASSFDEELLTREGEALGRQCQAKDLAVLLGPGANIKRSPLCGRNFEYISEDPYLSGKLAAAWIRGLQSRGIGASLKHFACNNQEFSRMGSSSEVDERTFREIYLTPFEIAVKEGKPATVMCAYNKINGTFCSENKRLLSDILRTEWGYEGAVVTDWGAAADRVKGIEAGEDLEMPDSGGENDALIVKAVREGRLDEALVDRAVENILKVVFDYTENRTPDEPYDLEAYHALAVEIETQCAVLLENNGVLPLKAGQKAAYIGAYAETPRYQGSGSSRVNASRVSSALETARGKGREVTFVRGFPAEGDVTNAAALEKAVSAAKSADVAVIFAGLPDSFESEGFDREHMRLPDCQNKLIEAVIAAQPNTVVVLHNGASVECPWAGSAAAVLEMYLGGQGVGEATDALLWGEANPSGRLAETFPLRLEDNPSYLYFGGDGKKVNYAEGVYVGYRYYDKKKMPVRWAFGHGLSYTSFEYTNLRTDKAGFADGEKLTVSVDVRNTGSMEGREVVQLYISDRNGTPNRPVKELKGFKKINLEPGEVRTVTLELDDRSLSYYDPDLGDWYAPTGEYGILVGHASDDIRLETKVGFKTAKLLPFTVTNSVTVGQLLADPRTAPIIGAFLKERLAKRKATDLGTSSEADAKSRNDMMYAMPLKSMVSFHVLTHDSMMELIDWLNEAVWEN